MKLLAVLALLYLAVMLLAALTAPGTTPGDRRGSVSFGSSPVPATAEAVPEAAGRGALERHRPAATRSRPLGPHGGEFILTATAYTWTGQRTASGLWPAKGMAASNLFPLGTRLLVEGFGEVTVEDRVGCCSQLDLYMGSERQCVEFGRRQVHATVLLP